MIYSIFRCIKTIPIFFFALTVTAQGINDIKEKDTVFILFEQSEKFKKYNYNAGPFFKECIAYSYLYSEDEGVAFRCCHMLDFDRKALITTVKKRWLKKQLIITEEVLKNTNLVDATVAFTAKKIFIIETKDYKKRKVLSKQATLSSSYIPGGNDSLIQYEEIKN